MKFPFTPFRKIGISCLTALLLISAVLSSAKERKLDMTRMTPQNAGDIRMTKKGFSLGYSHQKRQAIFVGYLLNEESLKKKVNRSNLFKADPAIRQNPVQPKEYNRSGYDKGHLAPAADMAWSALSMEESFYMSNISPQLPGCNRGIWKRLETQLRSLIGPDTQFFIVAGPIFSESSDSLPNGANIPIPCAFYKVVIDLTPPYKAIGFLIPNAPTKKELRHFACTVNQVEAITQLDFFSALPDPEEDAAENQCIPSDWGL